MRLSAPGFEDVSPGAWIPYIEAAGRSRDLLDLVLRRAADDRRSHPALAALDDISVNLKPAHDMGMRTVWVRTDESVKRAAGTDLDHIHHQTDDLASWLTDWVAERSSSK